MRLAGAAAVLVSLWMPWYGIHVTEALRGQIDATAGCLVLLCFATADRSLSLAGAVALAGLVAVHLVSRPGPSGMATLAAGAWVALAGAAVALAGSLMSEEEDAVAAAQEPAWSLPR